LETGSTSWERNFGNPLQRVYHALFRGVKSKEYKYDAFISHAVEDKLPIANELCDRLEKAGFDIWYSGRELRVGDSVTQTIVDGLRESRFGIVIFSPTYVSKMWTLREFFSLLVRRENEKKVILPILYNITPEDLARKDLTMADIFSLRAEKGMDYLVNYLTKEMAVQKAKDLGEKQLARKWQTVRTIVVVSIIVLLCVFMYYSWSRSRDSTPDATDIRKGVQGRINEIEREVASLLREKQFSVTVPHDKVLSRFREFQKLNTYYRNEFHLDYVNEDIHHRKNVEQALKVNFDTITASNHYTLDSALIFESQAESGDTNRREYAFVNPVPIVFELGELIKINEDIYRVEVRYKENIRLVRSVLNFPRLPEKKKGVQKKYEVILHALIPEEHFVIEKKNGEWTCRLAD
jgi:hypothetical protein